MTLVAGAGADFHGPVASQILKIEVLVGK